MSLMLKLIELMIISAAVDGKIDVREQEAIVRILTQNNQTPPLSNGQLASIQDQLVQRFKDGETRESVLTQAAQSLDDNGRHLAYAIAVEVVMSDGQLTTGEADYLCEQRTILALNPEKVEKIHFSAKLRYGFGNFN
jgi:uncharacterized tellurite resistance protein B-like protein